MNLRQQLTDSVGKGHLSYSSIKYALGDMRLWEMYMRGQLKKQSDALTFGTLYDMLLFERDKAIETYVVLNSDTILSNCSEKTINSKKPAMTSEYKAIKADMVEQITAEGKEVCSEEDWQQANDMIERLGKFMKEAVG